MRTRRAVSVAVLISAALLVINAAPAQAADTFPEYDRYFDPGPAPIPYAGTKWVPQGLTKVDEKTLAISYYDWKGGSNSIVALTDRMSGRWLATYTLDIKAHVGGIAMTSDYFWVAADGMVFRYRASDVRRKTSGKLQQVGAFTNVRGKASYMQAQGETLWVGNFNSTAKDWMYQYQVGNKGLLTYLQDRRTPSEVQGVVVTSDRIIWSTSEGRTNPGRLIVWPYAKAYDGSSRTGNFVKAPNMIEGIVLAGGQLQAVFESGAAKYSGSPPPAGDGQGKADVIVRTVQHGSIPPLP